MNDIEERAKEKYKPIKDDFMVELSRNALTDDIRNGYIKGATEQHQIEIDKLKSILNALMIDTHDKAEIIKMMEQ